MVSIQVSLYLRKNATASKSQELDITEIWVLQDGRRDVRRTQEGGKPELGPTRNASDGGVSHQAERGEDDDGATRESALCQMPHLSRLNVNVYHDKGQTTDLTLAKLIFMNLVEKI